MNLPQNSGYLSVRFRGSARPSNNRSALLCGLLAVLCFTTVYGFPPAPYHTVYGIVRDQVGQALDVEGATIVLLKDSAEVGRTPIISGPRIDQNYELKIRIDADRPSTQLYSSAAVPADGLYSLVVEMNGQLFFPIEVSNTLTVGKGGGRVRLDLTLGGDSDGDGLPDIWEEWQLFQAGYFPDEEGWPINLIDRDDDFDGDGQSNYFEYIAGTFAGDGSDSFLLEIIERSPTSVRLEFFAITGKVYTLERSSDGKVWTRIPFSTIEGAQPVDSYRANDVEILPAYHVPPDATDKEFYRLSVR